MYFWNRLKYFSKAVDIKGVSKRQHVAAAIRSHMEFYVEPCDFHMNPWGRQPCNAT